MPDSTQKQGNIVETSNKTASSDQKSSTVPSISLPKGGGAIRGIGEKFSANPVTGTGSLNVPIFTSPGRSGFGPQLSLSYDSGSGNGPFGFGWSLSLSSITRKTDKGLPKYQDAAESDVFVLSGAEDLVPMLVEENGKWMKKPLPPRKINNVTYRIDLYRPRIEGLFARIERWTSEDGDVHWRSISKDNILTVYGRDDESRIFDSEDKSRIFSWLICESYDDKGNAIIYDYEPENSEGVDLSQANECNRLRTANRYLKRIKYGNRNPLLLDMNISGFRGSHIIEPDFAPADWMFEVVFDYGEGHYKELPLDNTRPESEQHSFVHASASAGGKWPCRPDPFSAYRSGFEIRTYRRCHRVLMFHRFEELFQNFPDLKKEPYLVHSTEFDYSDIDYSKPVDVETELKFKGSTRFASFIRKVTQSGYVRDESQPLSLLNGAKYLTYFKKSLPPLEFDYSQAIIQEEINEIDAMSLENMPYGLDGARYQWVDLDGEGVSGILTEQAESWFYKPNLGGGKFGAMETIATRPSLSSLNSGDMQLLDLAGDGQLDVAEFGGTVPGFYERTHDRKWENFIPFTSLPNVSWKDPNLKFVDLTGDGHADVLNTEDKVFTWYPSLAEDGFGPSEMVRQALDEEKGPRLVFDDGSQSIYLADFSGDGLTDLVRIRNGEVCYWPNLGYGHFGAKVTMDNPPRFDYPDMFNQKRIHLADIDGSGNTDIIYLGINGVQIYFNHSGNSWSSARKLVSFPHIDNLSSIQVADLFGNGTTCLVWSSPMPGDSYHPMLYIDLMGGQKPHLMVNSKNNMGAENVVKYAASTKFYLEDKARGKPWITRIPFPVHVVERVETYDRISRNRFVTRYAYHHGYFDAIEREFHGFGMVEQWDSEEFAVLSASDAFPSASNIDEASHIPPVLTKTWFHTGAYIEGEAISRQFEDEYYSEGDPSMGEKGLGKEQLEAMLLDDTLLPLDEITLLPIKLSAEETLEACRSLKGAILRQEIYALDGTEEEDRPYTVSERNYTIKNLQMRGMNKHAVFFTHARETINFHYERKLFKVAGNELAYPNITRSDVKNAVDPRVTHSFTLDVDEYGNVRKSVSVGYGRRFKDSSLSEDDQKKQEEILITSTENHYTNAVLEDDAYRTPLPGESRTFEVFKVQVPSALAGVTPPFKFKFLNDLVESADFSSGNWDIPYEDAQHAQATGNHEYRRLIEHVRTVYRKNNLTGLLLSGELESLALPGESYKLGFTSGLLSSVYQRKLDNPPSENLLPDPLTVLSGTGGDRGGYLDLDGNGHWWIPSGRVFYGIKPNDKNPAATAVAELTEACTHFFLPRKFTDPFGSSTTIDYDKSDLLIENTKDAAGNSVRAENDYRILQPYLVTDPNGNRSHVIFDTLGMVAGTAVMGKEKEPDGKSKGDLLDGFKPDLTQAQLDAFMARPREPGADSSEGAAAQIMHDLLGKATSRIIYDIDRFKRTGEPPFTATIARETHTFDLREGQLSKLQVSFSYSDGFGREIQKKIQAEPGPIEGVSDHVNPRWVGSGWTIFNNKGKPVRQYEPYFSDTHHFEFSKIKGVSSILFYDPVERVIATLHPNNTYEKVTFDPWHQKTYDVNDTVAMDPRIDADISGYVAQYFKQIAPQANTWKTWLGQRGIDPNAPPQEFPGMDPEKKAAVRSLPHADTPTAAYFDTLGRPFLTIANNGKDENDKEILYKTHVVLDIEGNQREIIDAQDRIVMLYDYDMLGSRIHQASMEAGERWMLNDIAGKPIRTWDCRGFIRSMTYDVLRRPVELSVIDASGMEFLAEKTVYGESRPDPETTNHRTKPWKVYDGAGIMVSDRFDFKGNPVQSSRQLLPQPYHKIQVDWNINPQPDETFTSSTTYDALNRPIQMIAPHGTGGKLNVIQPVYNEANFIEREDVWLEENAEPAGLLDPNTASQHAVKNINYNAKGQREFIEYGNGASTSYEYDPLTFRLTHLQTLRSKDKLQDLFYTYDPSGNITAIRDDARQTIYFSNSIMQPESSYTYDAIYRLIKARGREHIGSAQTPWPTWDDRGRTALPQPGNPQQMRNYTEEYFYDEVGNIDLIKHSASNGNGTNPNNWIRKFTIDPDPSDPTKKKTNRLIACSVGNQTENFTYDIHGNMTRMPHFNHIDPAEPNMYWDFKDQLQMVDKGGDCKAYYVYDATGQRVHKVMEQNDTCMNERIYLGGFEIYRKYSATDTLERETIHIMDDKQRIALVETRTLDTADNDSTQPQLIRYQFGNHLGSASLELDDKGNVISYEEYYPYGSTSYQAVDQGIKAAAKRYRYTGKERDEETGLYYHGARYYAPWLGGWINTDPGNLTDGINLYAYVRRNPAIHRDPTGFVTEDEGGNWKPKNQSKDPAESPQRERGKGRFKRGQGEEQREGLERARENAKKNRPSTMDNSEKRDPKTSDEWEGESKRPKQRKIESGKKTEDRDRKERDDKYKGKDPQASNPDNKKTSTHGAPGGPYRQPGERPFQPDHPYFPEPTPRQNPSPAPSVPAPVPVPEPTPKPVTEPGKPYFPEPSPPKPIQVPQIPGSNSFGLTPEQLERSNQMDKPLVQNIATEAPFIAVASGVFLLLAPAGAAVVVGMGVRSLAHAL